MACGEEVDGFQRMASEAPVSWLDGTQQILPEVDLATLEQRYGLRPSERLAQFHLNVRVTAREVVQEIDEHAFDDLRRRCDPQHAGIAAPEQLGALAERARIIQKNAAI